jgi:hypothetical protein
VLVVETRPLGDAVNARRRIQGDPPTASCPAWGEHECPEVDVSCAELPSAPHDSLDLDAPSPRE